MDPVSFTASLVTVIGLVTVSSQKIFSLRAKLRNAPKDIEDLLAQLHIFEGLLKELEVQLRYHQQNATPEETLQKLWEICFVQMQRDVKSFHDIVSRVEPLLKKSLTSKWLLSARHILGEEEVALYQGKIEIHCGTLRDIQGIVSG